MVADNGAAAPASPASAIAILGRLMREAVSYGKYYLQAAVGKAKLTLATVLGFAAIGLAGGLAGLAVVVTAGVLLTRGIAELLTEFLGGHEWAGDIITGVLILGVVLGGAFFGVKYLTKSLRTGFKAGLDDMRREQRETFGTDVHERSEGKWEAHVAD